MPAFFSLSVCLTLNSDIKNLKLIFSACTHSMFDVNEITHDYLHDCIGRLKKGKATGFDDITSEHIIYAHPLLALHLSHLFRMVLQYCVVYLMVFVKVLWFR